MTILLGFLISAFHQDEMITLALKNRIETAVRDRIGEQFDALEVRPGVLVVQEKSGDIAAEKGKRSVAEGFYWSCQLDIDGGKYDVYFH